MAKLFLKYYNDTLQFQSTLAYLKNPPSSYQQPAVDVIGRINTIYQDVVAGTINSQYEFEANLQKMVVSTRDSHLQLETGLFSIFSSASPYALVSLSTDGLQEPKVYVTGNVLTSENPSPMLKLGR